MRIEVVPGTGSSAVGESGAKRHTERVSREEAFLWWSYRRSGDPAFRDALLEFYGGWIQGLAMRFARSRRLDWREVWGAAALGLMGAVARFDPGTGVPFRLFARERVEGSLFDAAREALREPARFQASQVARDETNAGESFLPPEPFGTLASPLEAAMEQEVRSGLLGVMPDEQTREIARRRFWLAESVDEIGLGLGLGKSRVQELLARVILPRAREFLKRAGVARRRR